MEDFKAFYKGERVSVTERVPDKHEGRCNPGQYRTQSAHVWYTHGSYYLIVSLLHDLEGPQMVYTYTTVFNSYTEILNKFMKFSNI